jgi:hypothetical protein
MAGTNGDTDTNKPEIVNLTGRGRWARLAEAVIDARTGTQRAVDRGDTVIHLANSAGTHGGRLAIEFTEPDGARWSMTYDALSGTGPQAGTDQAAADTGNTPA